MYNRMRDRYQAILAVGRQLTHLIHQQGSMSAGFEALKHIGREEQMPIINALERAFTHEQPIDDRALGKSIGPYGILQKLIIAIQKEGGDPIAVLPHFDRMLLSINEQTRALWVSISGFLIYMTAVLFVAASVFGILMIYVIPSFDEMFSSFGADLPGLTQWVTGNNAAIFYSGLLGFGLLVFALLITVLHVFDVSGKLLPLNRSLRFVPFMRQVTHTYNRLLAYNYARLFVGAGLTDDRALELAAQLANDEPLARLTSGKPLSKQRRDQAIWALAIAKEASNLESELDYHINDQNYQLASDFTSARQKSLFVLHILLALFVGLFVIAMYLPIFKMGEVG